MTAAPHSIDPEQFLHEQLAQASPDLMRNMLQTFVNALLSEQADAVCGAAYGTRTGERTNRRNGYRRRPLDTRVGTLDVAVPKLREGTYFPGWPLERRKRAEAALTSVVANCYLLGVSTRRMAPPQAGGTPSWCRPSASPGCRSRRSVRWPRTSTSRSRSSGPARWTTGRTRSSPPTR